MGFYLLIVPLFLSLAFSSSQPVRGNAELRALMEVKAALDPEGKLLYSWTSDGDHCGGLFEGVACNGYRKVTNISLQGKGLSGKLSPALAELKCLTGLYLHYNSLSGEIPREITMLNELTDLYLDVNNFTGSIPVEIGNMTNLQVLQLCCNGLTSNLPAEMGSMKRLTVLAVQHNRLTGEIPASLGNLELLERLDLSFNAFSGPIPVTLGRIPQLEVFDLQNNSLSGIVPSSLRRLNEGFQGGNNRGLCGVGFSSVRICTAFDRDDSKSSQFGPVSQEMHPTPRFEIPESANVQPYCSQTRCSKSKTFPRNAVVAAAVLVSFLSAGVLILTFFWYRRRKQKIGSTYSASEGRISTDQAKDLISKSASPLVRLEYSSGWDPLDGDRNIIGFSHEHLSNFRFNIEEVESATHHFSDGNILRKSGFSAVYRGVLRDGSHVAIRSLNLTSCKSEESEFLKGLNLLTSLRHENLVRLRGFCSSKDRGEFFLIYDYALKGNISQFLDVEDGSNLVLDWSKRVSIISGIAKGLAYLHSSEGSKPAMVHQNISVEKILIDNQFRPMISDSGLPRLLADDMVFSALKVSAAMGYLAPEYITTGRFTEKSDVYAFGVIILQILSGTSLLSNSIRLGAEKCRFEDFIDRNLKGKFSEFEAAKLAKVAVGCTHELPTLRPMMEAVVIELSSSSGSSH